MDIIGRNRMRGIGERETYLNSDRLGRIWMEVYKSEIENLVAQVICNELVWVRCLYLESSLC